MMLMGVSIPNRPASGVYPFEETQEKSRNVKSHRTVRVQETTQKHLKHHCNT
jgi:hypothetical protein